MIFRAWGVVCAKGRAVFLDNTRALEYATKQHGIIVKLMGQYEYNPENLVEVVEPEEVEEGRS